eukprot:TRINITY_DN25937_c0_g1_i1.p1 TRINITY_DN25937_c0_g1~~TRINITY_DN25937_c0_g1_i1.p1  ORF type:complete len:438 (-),score=81.97 TRINITY_DN25937_c0_g1_i1:146-1459(-)
MTFSARVLVSFVALTGLGEVPVALSAPDIKELLARLGVAEKKGELKSQAKLHYELAYAYGLAFNRAGKADQRVVTGQPELIEPITRHFNAALKINDGEDIVATSATVTTATGTATGATGKGRKKSKQGVVFSAEEELLALKGLAHGYYLMQQTQRALPVWSKLVQHPLCLQEEVSRQGNCYSIHMNRMQGALLEDGKVQDAIDVFKETLKLRHDGQAVVPWSVPLQVPLSLIPGLEAKPFWDNPTEVFQTARLLESSYKIILNEVLRVPDKAWRLHYDGDLVTQGSWTEFLLFDHGKWLGCEIAPDTCKLLRDVEEVHGEAAEFSGAFSPQISFLRLMPRTRLRSHTGPTNARLTLHLGLQVPEDAGLSVAQDSRKWVEGEVIAFDDSFLHSAWNNATKVRSVLYVTVWHPDIFLSKRRSDGKGSIRSQRKSKADEL